MSHLPEIKLIDTTLRDGQMSLWAMNMKTGVMLPAMEVIDGAGFAAAEFFIPTGSILKMARDLGENAFHWLVRGSELALQTPLRITGGLTGNYFMNVPMAVRELLFRRVVDCGITVTRFSDPWNDFDDLEAEIVRLRALGMESVVNVVYSVSPKHTDEYYVEKAEQLAAIRPYRVCFKDVGGLLTQARARALLPRLLKAVGNVTLELHGHCNNGLAPHYYLDAAACGVEHLHTAIPPLANGSSQPSVFNVSRNLRRLGFEVDVDEASLEQVSKHLTYVARREGLALGSPVEFDQAIYEHQIPGGMISNLQHQLASVGMSGRLEATLEEATHVRRDFGYPIMVTPLAQFVGSQAALNVISGERYGVVSDGTIEYSLGRWGKQAVADMDPQIREKILSLPRAKELANLPVEDDADESLEAIREKLGGRAVTDEELILRTYAGEYAERALRSSPPTSRGRLLGGNSVVDLVEELTRQDRYKSVFLEKGGHKLSVSSSQLPDGG